jgi:alpha-glucosidase (family GH31 glycosyl hydrolase)
VAARLVLFFTWLALTPLWACSDDSAQQPDQGLDSKTGTDLGPAPEAPWPEWAYQHWIWEGESTQQSALDIVDGYLERDIPVGAIIIDSPWATGYNTFEFDPELFPDPQGMIDALHAKGVRVMLWVVPAINVEVTDLYQEAADKGYFMQLDADSGPHVFNWWKGDGSLIDYFNPEVVAWWHQMVDKALALDIDGWKCDGLDFQALITSYSPSLGKKVERLEYSHTYYRDFFDYTREKLGKDRLITARPVDNYGLPVGGEDVSFAPIDITWAGWVGDQDATFAGLKAALMNLYYSAEMGYVAFGSDIGGYRNDDSFPEGRGKELFVRWAQLGALSPVMENGGGGEHRPWMFDEQTTDIYRRFVKLHHALIPYLMEHGARAFAQHRSLMTFLDKRVTYNYLLGPDILVAPMTEPGTRRTVAFPEGSSWIYLFDRDQVFEGGTEEELTIVLEEFPVFLRQGSDIASQLEV